MARVKGTAVDASMRYVRERFGEAAPAGILGALPPADGFIISRAAAVFGSYSDTGEMKVGSIHLVHSACVHRGDALCRFEATWE